MTRAIAALLCLGTATTARAGGGPATDAYDDVATGVVDVHALADVYVQHDFGRPPRAHVLEQVRGPGAPARVVLALKVDRVTGLV